MTTLEQQIGEPQPAGPTAAESVTPDARGAWKRLRGWLIALVGLLGAALITVLMVGSMNLVSNRLLDPTSPAPNGAKALFEVLGQHGVDTEYTETLEATDAALDRPDGATLVLDDPSQYLVSQQVSDLVERAGTGIDRLVLLDPTGSAWDLMTEAASFEGSYWSAEDAGANELEMPATFAAGADCPLAENAPEITNLGGTEYTPLEGGTGCYQVRDGYAVVFGEIDGIEVVVIGSNLNLTNEQILRDANAAFAVNLLGKNEHLVWYTASADDVLGDMPTLGDYVPPWLTPVILLLAAAGVACVIWRGRRFGPLVAERLPVTVPAAETIEGRARLYDHGDARLHALDSIRLGTLTRLADLLGLGRTAAAEAVADATAATAGVPREHAFRVLLGANPGSDAELVELANACAELETRVRAATGRDRSNRTFTREQDNDE
ncbi:DUF4350 domain-containing protein [Gulosibacter faecalis]|uniref:DUF4350 domain-containing protein n=1 Tax=Gulosibacter faecalis TaxID=272240 RepID=A0ABW5V1I3_9MICO|nr:DUF4350 domain-containing protein [Gulosibacter faecalis]